MNVNQVSTGVHIIQSQCSTTELRFSTLPGKWWWPWERLRASPWLINWHPGLGLVNKVEFLSVFISFWLNVTKSEVTPMHKTCVRWEAWIRPSINWKNNYWWEVFSRLRGGLNLSVWVDSYKQQVYSLERKKSFCHHLPCIAAAHIFPHAAFLLLLSTLGYVVDEPWKTAYDT